MNQKRSELGKHLKQMLCYEKLIKRNRKDESDGEKYHFPFILFSTKDNN
jgi:hypothetical protein